MQHSVQRAMLVHEHRPGRAQEHCRVVPFCCCSAEDPYCQMLLSKRSQPVNHEYNRLHLPFRLEARIRYRRGLCWAEEGHRVSSGLLCNQSYSASDANDYSFDNNVWQCIPCGSQSQRTSALHQSLQSPGMTRFWLRPLSTLWLGPLSTPRSFDHRVRHLLALHLRSDRSLGYH